MFLDGERIGYCHSPSITWMVVVLSCMADTETRKMAATESIMRRWHRFI